MRLEDALQQRGISFSRSRSDPDEIILCCPFCVQRDQTPDTRFRLGVNLRTGKAHCFNCDWASRRVWGPLARALNLGLLQEGTKEKKKEVAAPIDLPEDFVLLSDPKAKKDFWGRKAWKYLRGRHVTEEQVVRHKIGYSMAGTYAYRLVFPVLYGQKLMGLVSRFFVSCASEKRLRYLNSPGMKSLYNCPKKDKAKSVIAVEGVFKCLAVERVVGVGKSAPNVVALLGHSLTEEQEQMLDGYKEVILWPDPDRQGTLGMIRVANTLRGQFDVKWVLSTVQKSPDDMTRDEIAAQIPKGVRAWDGNLELRVRAEVAFRER